MSLILREVFCSSHSSHVCWALSAYKLSPHFALLFFFVFRFFFFPKVIFVSLLEQQRKFFSTLPKTTVIFCEFSTH